MNARKRQQRAVILLVEEDGRVRRDIAKHLVEHGFDVIEASDSDQALALLQGRADVRGFVTDAHVPGRIDGFELARVVRERWPDIGVVMMSGHSDASSGPIPPGGEFIAKPYLFEYLAPTLRRFLARP
jgi:two-component system, response regulator PdtaR